MHSLGATFSAAIFLLFLVGIPFLGLLRGVEIFPVFIKGAKKSTQFTIALFPSLVALLVAIAMFRAAGGFELLTHALGPLLTRVGFPTELLPLSIIRPFSGAASNAYLANLAQAHGGNSALAQMGAVMIGSTETTLYVVAIYFGAVGIRRTRYAVGVGLFSDLIGIIAAVVAVNYLL